MTFGATRTRPFTTNSARKRERERERVSVSERKKESEKEIERKRERERKRYVNAQSHASPGENDRPNPSAHRDTQPEGTVILRGETARSSNLSYET